MLIHDFEEDPQYGKAYREGLQPLLTDKVLHIHIIVFTQKLQHPKGSAHYVYALLFEGSFFRIITFNLMVPLHHVQFLIV